MGSQGRETLRGFLKSYDEVTRYGFVCAGLNQDVLIRFKNMPKIWCLGQRMRFTLKVKNGNPQVKAVIEWEEEFKWSLNMRTLAHQGSAPLRVVGRLKEVREKCAFLACNVVGNITNQDAFILPCQIHPADRCVCKHQHGRLVEFTVFFNNQSKPQGRELSWDVVPRETSDAQVAILNYMLLLLFSGQNGGRYEAMLLAHKIKAANFMPHVDLIPFVYLRIGRASEYPSTNEKIEAKIISKIKSDFWMEQEKWKKQI